MEWKKYLLDTQQGIRIWTQQHHSPLPLALGILWMCRAGCSSCTSLWARGDTGNSARNTPANSRFPKLLDWDPNIAFCMSTDFPWNTKKNAVFRYSYTEPVMFSAHSTLWIQKLAHFVLYTKKCQVGNLSPQVTQPINPIERAGSIITNLTGSQCHCMQPVTVKCCYFWISKMEVNYYGQEYLIAGWYKAH